MRTTLLIIAIAILPACSMMPPLTNPDPKANIHVKPPEPEVAAAQKYENCVKDKSAEYAQQKEISITEVSEISVGACEDLLSEYDRLMQHNTSVFALSWENNLATSEAHRASRDLRTSCLLKAKTAVMDIRTQRKPSASGH